MHIVQPLKTKYENIRKISLRFLNDHCTIVLRNHSYMNNKPIKATEKELEILQIVWSKDAVSVKEVHEAWVATSPTATPPF